MALDRITVLATPSNKLPQLLDRLEAHFISTFGRRPSWIVQAPGRVNLIGDHTDYNDGFVLPMAINKASWFAAAERSDQLVRVSSAGYGLREFALNDLRPQGTFIDYLSGVAWAMGPSDLRGLDLAIESDLPAGAGLGSSASVSMAACRVFSASSQKTWDPVKSAAIARRAENEWIGVASGIMDQLSIGLARAGFATLIDCRSLEINHVRLPESIAIVVLDSGTRRELSASEYNERRSTCSRAAAACGATSLRDVSVEMLQQRNLGPLERRRARHVISENERVLQFVDALEQGEIEHLGELLTESHRSLARDFEVSTPALDRLVYLAKSSPGCVGARLTGAGMGGCAVAVVRSESVGEFIKSLSAALPLLLGPSAAVFESLPSGSLRVLRTPDGDPTKTDQRSQT